MCINHKLNLKEALSTVHKQEILNILNKHSSRLRYRRDELKTLFKKLEMNVEFSMSEIKDVLPMNYQSYKIQCLL